MTTAKRKHAALTLGLLAVTCLTGAGQQGKPEEKAASRTLKVKLNYTGAGTVDEKHKIFVFLFDSPDFVQGGEVMPFEMQAGAGKAETLTFPALAVSPVYVVAAYDPNGDYDGQSGPPPAGSSMAIYSKSPGTPEPVKIDPGKAAEIELAFDDSFKMP